MLPSTPRLFGTDGVRGPAGQPPLDAASVTRLGRALGRFLSKDTSSPRAILAGDTRSSTPSISAWLVSGLEETGCSVSYGGVLPTPAVARLAASTEATVGIAISASHNLVPDNGVKLLDGHGFKWPRAAEAELEAMFTAEPIPAPEEVSRLEVLEPPSVDAGLREDYIQALSSLFAGRPLEGLSVLLDTANGAASGTAPALFEELGAKVAVVGNRPDGSNINLACGSTHPDLAARRTVTERADLGFAFDGDADRVMASDETGAVHDGDAILYVLACSLLNTGQLVPPRIVATSMSNLGLEVALREAGVDLVRCDVGDRAVVETLKSEGLVLGGEQSGHIVHLGLASTGDGLLSAALLAQAAHSAGEPLSRLAAGFIRFPQVLVNVRVPSKPPFETLPRTTEETRRVTARLRDRGRLVLRYSGTEPLARVMVEGEDQSQVEELAQGLAATIESEIASQRKTP